MNAYTDRKPHYVYRAFDSYGILLYVGCSHNVKERLASHRYGPWHRYAETVGISRPFSKVDALRLEADAIRSEAPHFNATTDDMRRSRANRHAAQAITRQRRLAGEKVDIDRVQQQLSDSGRYPRLTVADRLARYLAARGDAERARLECAA